MVKFKELHFKMRETFFSLSPMSVSVMPFYLVENNLF